jgi:PD-(D/E)XK nuclease superfamily
VPIPVHYDGIIVGTFRADLVVDRTIVVEVKSEAALTGVHIRQLRNYLAGSEFEVGIVVVYGIESQFKRLIHTNDRKRLRSSSVAVSAKSVEIRAEQPNKEGCSAGPTH